MRRFLKVLAVTLFVFVSSVFLANDAGARGGAVDGGVDVIAGSRCFQYASADFQIPVAAQVKVSLDGQGEEFAPGP